MNCNHFACFIDERGRERRQSLPGRDTSCYASGDTVTVEGQHFLLGAAHKEHYGARIASLAVMWDAKEVPTPAPHLTRGRD